jgi:hypothetical protein
VSGRASVLSAPNERSKRAMDDAMICFDQVVLGFNVQDQLNPRTNKHPVRHAKQQLNV